MKTAILLNDTSYETHIGSRTVVETLNYLCKKYDINIIKKYTRNQCVELIDEIVPLLDQVDLILINGEGSLHHHPRPSTAFFKLVMEYIQKRHKVILFNTIWQEIKYTGLSKHLDKINLISVRESHSYNELIKQCSKNKVIITPDLIFYNKFADRDNIGYGDSVIYKIRSSFKRKTNYFPLNNINTGTYLHPKTLTHPTMKAYIAWLKTLDLFITGRFHGVCLAMITQTPFLVYSSNSHKIEGLLKDANCSDLLIKSTKDIANKQDMAKEIIKNSKSYVTSAKIKIESLFKEIIKL